MRKTLTLLLLMLAAFSMTSCRVVVRRPAVHPYYLHALSDLRLARAYLDRLTPEEQLDMAEVSAIDQINAAINEIKQAAIDDGKDIADHPAIDAHLKRANRYIRALELLNKVHQDINREEDNAYANHLKVRALKHIDRAREIVKHLD